VLDHFLCYKAQTARGTQKFEKRKVGLADEFGERSAELIRTTQFCNAVDKNGEGINDPTAHLTCYKIRRSEPVKAHVISTDAFGELQLNLRRRSNELCVPSLESGKTPSIDNFELYRTTRKPRASKFVRREVQLADQFLEETVRLNNPVRLGVATDKNNEGVNDADSHLTCYSLRAPRFKKRDVEVENQFGQFRLTVRKPNMLCVPSENQIVSKEP
jgi:hypothetical protein